MPCLDVEIADRAIIDGQRINITSLDQGVEAAIAQVIGGKGFSFFSFTLDHVAKRRHDPEFRAACDGATFIAAGSSPIAGLGRQQYDALERMVGADLVVPLVKRAARVGLPVGFFGTDIQTLETCTRKLQRMAPRLRVAGWESPLNGVNLASPAVHDAIARLAEAGARIIFLALNSPKQELLAHQMRQRFPEIGFVCIGSGLDAIAGNHERVSLLVQDVGLGWVWRLITNPRRMTRRYASRGLALFSLLRNPTGKQQVQRA